MGLLSSVFGCFVPSSSSSVSDSSSINDKPKTKSKEKSPRAPIPVAYFPMNSRLSYL